MKNSLISASVISLIGFGISSIALADDGIPVSTYCHPGFYVGLQGGRTDTYYSPNNLFIDQAEDNGGGSQSVTTTTLDYKGNVLIGTASVEVNSSTTITGLNAQETDTVGLGGRVYAGYQFMPYFAAELGYTQFAKTSASANGTATTTSNDTVTNYCNAVPDGTSDVTNGQTTTFTKYSADVTEEAVDLVAKGTLPLPYGFGLYAKAGMAYITAERDINSHETGQQGSGVDHYFDATQGPISSTPESSATSFSNVDTFSTVYTTTYQGFRPVAGVGVDYTIPNSNFDIEGSYTRIFSSGAIPDADLLALGVNYKFC